MHLLYSPLSPFAAKARMAAHLCGVPLTCVNTDTTAEPDDLLAANPLGKIPTLVLDDGSCVYDSRVICEYIDRGSGHRVIPQSPAEWLEAKRFEATSDGVTDALILTVYEVRYRPEDKRHQPWVDKQSRKADRGLALLTEWAENVPGQPHVGHLSLAALIAWMDVRFEGRIARDYPALAACQSAFAAKFPDLKPLLPHMPA